MNLKLKLSLLANLLLLLSFTAAQAQNAARTECFSFDNLTPVQKKAGEELLLKAMDEAALYTIIGGLKPMSSSIKSFQLQTSLPRIELAEAEKNIAALGAKKAEELTNAEKSLLAQSKAAADRANALAGVAETRAILAEWRCGGEYFADVQHFERAFDGKRYMDAFIISKPTLQKKIAEKADFFSRWGITPNSHPLEVLYSVDTDKGGGRFGGYGYLFGYPDHAVKFFVDASNEEEFTGKFVERDFYAIPTFARETGNFTYAVPKGYAAIDIDTALRAKAERILTEYKKRRAEYIGEGKKGVVELLRDWLCDANGKCSSANAKF